MKLIIFLLALITTTSLYAESAEKEGPPCVLDIKKFCSQVKNGQGRLVKCLAAHTKEISPQCSAKLSAGKEKMKNKAKEIYNNCKDDLQKLCKEPSDLKMGKFKCLEAKKDQTSDKCKSVLP